MDKDAFLESLLQQSKEIHLHVFAEGEQCSCQVIVGDSIYENIEILGESGNLESIFVAKIDKIMPSANGAFLDIGDKKMAFLPLQEKPSFMKKNPEILKQGTKVLVQVKKEENASKGALLSRDIKIAGKHLMLMPFNSHITWSARITDKDMQSKLLQFGKQFSKGEFGIVFRSLAEFANKEEMAAELLEQKKTLDAILNTYQSIKPPYCVYRKNYGLMEFCLDIKKLQIPCKVKVNVPVLVDSLQELQSENFQIFFDNTIQKIELNSLKKNQRERIALSNQANIVIDYCEALTVFDVNSASSHYTDSGTSFFQTNCIAAVEILRQIQLKNIYGLILVDFINMLQPEDYERLLGLLQELKKLDRIPSVIHGFTKTGLLEITRKRTSAGENNEVKK